MDRIRSGKVASPAKHCVLPDFGDEALHTRSLFVCIAQAFAVTKEWPVNQIHVNCMPNKVIADFGGLDYSAFQFSSIVLSEGACQVYLQEKGLPEANKFDSLRLLIKFLARPWAAHDRPVKVRNLIISAHPYRARKFTCHAISFPEPTWRAFWSALRHVSWCWLKSTWALGTRLHTTSCIERARYDRADGHCYSFAWI